MYKRALAGYEKAHEAETMYERALAGYEKALGPEHISTLDTVNNLGLHYRKRHYLLISSSNRLRDRDSVFASKQDTSTEFMVSVSRLWPSRRCQDWSFELPPHPHSWRRCPSSRNTPNVVPAIG
jgi:hypothetical protein